MAVASPSLIAPYKPLEWQIAPWRDKSPVLLLTGSAGGGKSRVAAEKVHAFMLKYPGATGLMLRKAREYTTKSIVPFMQRRVIAGDSRVTMRKSESVFEYNNGSMLFWGGMKDDSQREAIRSIGQDGALDIVWIEEANAFSEMDYEEVTARMRGRAAGWTQILPTTNPGPPTHWIKKRLIDGREASVYYSGAQDNSYNPPQYLDNLKRLTGVMYQRLVLGRWVQAEGTVYDEFDDQIHVIDPFEIPRSWRRIRVVDFGYANPFVCQWWAMDDDDRMYLYREIYMSQCIVEDHARQITALSAGEAIEATIADHDAEDRATLARYGVSTIAAIKDVSPGIQAVQRRLRKAHKDKPRLFIMRGATVEEDTRLADLKKPTSTLEEFPAYIWAQSQDGRPVKEVPVKVDDHGMDAMRYGVMYIDGPRYGPPTVSSYA